MQTIAVLGKCSTEVNVFLYKDAYTAMFIAAWLIIAKTGKKTQVSIQSIMKYCDILMLDNDTAEWQLQIKLTHKADWKPYTQ